MQDLNPYESIASNIEKVIEETPTITTFVLKPEKPVSFATGQFIELAVPGMGEAPFTPSSLPSAKGNFDMTIMKVGRVTEAVHKMKKGETVFVRGPYGKGYPLDKFEGKDVLLVGGGVGLAPLRSLLLSLIEGIDKYNKVILKYGARTPEDIIYKEEVKKWADTDKVEVGLTVDKANGSWNGNVGVVTTILENLNKEVDLKNSVAVVCGPPIMMKFAVFKLMDVGYKEKDIYLSMEKNMSCGFGKCGHCRIGNFYACKDGPVFTYDVIKGFHEVWD